jgi:hypothetical protein
MQRLASLAMAAAVGWWLTVCLLRCRPARTVVFGNLASPAVAAAVVAKVRTLGQLEQLRESLTQDDLANNSEPPPLFELLHGSSGVVAGA